MESLGGDALVGRLLGGRYRVDELIARGGMASVYRGTDTRLGRTVALKVMAPAFADDPEFEARFAREATAAAGIYDGNVVVVHDQGDDDGLLFLVMEYVPGHTLRDLINERGRLSPTETLDVIEPVFAALQAAHVRGLVHRDVKPENVLIGIDGRVKVTDFGLARAVAGTPASPHTQGVIMGTMTYLAPEQTRGIADARSDVYSAGIIAFEMLTGAPPFTDDTALGLAYRHVNDVVPAPSTKVDGIPPSLDALVLTLTQQDPDARPLNGAAALALVERARRGLLEPPSTGPVSEQPTVIVPLPPPDPSPSSAIATAPPTAVATPVDGVVVDAGPPGRRRRRGRGWIALLLVVLLAAGAAGIAWWLGSGRYTTVPGVVGISAKQAETKLGENGLAFEYAKPAYSEIVPAGQVLASDPEPGGRIANGGTVTLTLSKGPERYDVPKVVGLTVPAARKKLAARTLVVAQVTREYSDSVAEGRVISSSPKAGVEVRADAAVDLVVSKGPPPVPVPNLVGMSYDEAARALSGVGLAINQVGERYADGTTKGEVLSQSPGRGVLVDKGATVDVVISKGPPLVEVPSVIDMKASDAVKTLKAAGFLVDDYWAFGVNVPGVDRVMSQDPNGGELAPKGSTVTIGLA